MVERMVRTYGRCALKGIGKRARIALFRARGSWPFPKLIHTAKRFFAASTRGTPKGAAPPWNPASSGKAGTGHKSNRRGRAALEFALERAKVAALARIADSPTNQFAELSRTGLSEPK